MRIVSTRFGTIDIDESEVIDFPHGMIGFPAERQYVLLRNGEDSAVGWLQSTTLPSLAFPVVSSEALAVDYSHLDMKAHSDDSDEADEYAVMVVLCAPSGRPATVNLLAPILVNVATRTGAQVIVDHPNFSTQDPLALRVLPKQEPPKADHASAPLHQRMVEAAVAEAR